MLKVEITGFANELHMGYSKRSVHIFVLSNERIKLQFTEMGKSSEEASLEEKSGTQFWLY